MADGLTWDDEAFRRRLSQRAGRALLAKALRLQAAHKAALSVGNPAPHERPAPRGEFPRLRTGFGRAQVAVEPATIVAAAAAGRVTVGVRRPGFYLAALAAKGWLGLLDTYRRVRGTLGG